jgi:glyoxylase-like metal-dependent hydrolase (beta-lactamase superfamily II)
VTQSVEQSWYQTDRIRDDLFCITEAHYAPTMRANIWLIKGRDAYLMIDTGLGLSSLKSYVADVIDKPLKVIASHVHFDHSGCCHEFDDVYIHENELHALRSGNQRQMMSTPDFGWIQLEDFSQLPYAGFSADNYVVQSCPQAQALKHGDVIDLGDKAFEVIHLPGHSSGSIGLYNRKSAQLYSGDVVYDGDLLDDLEDSVVDEYITTMEKLLQLPADEVRPGHFQSFDRRRLQNLVTGYLESRKAPRCPSDPQIPSF